MSCQSFGYFLRPDPPPPAISVQTDASSIIDASGGQSAFDERCDQQGDRAPAIKASPCSFELFSFCFLAPICIKKKKESIAETFEYQFFLPLQPPDASLAVAHYATRVKTQLKGGRHKEMTPARKRPALGRAPRRGENQWEGTLPYTETAQWEGKEGVWIFLSFFCFFTEK